MPELPEVETIRRHLAPHVDGRTLHALEIHDARWTLPLAPPEVATAVAGRRGKYLVWELEDDVYLMLHLRMTGTLLLDPPERPPHTRVTFDLGEHTLEFVDPRRFGTGELALGIESKGATIDDFRDPEGVSGSFQDRFLIHLREGEPCVRCGRPVRKLRAAGRGTYVCESCQPRPRARPPRQAPRAGRRGRP